MIGQTSYRTPAEKSGKSISTAMCGLSGWVENLRDHGGINCDLRDHYGVVQIVIHDEKLLQGVNRECVVSVSEIVLRDAETINQD